MTTINIPAVYKDWIIISSQEIKRKPDKITLVVEYKEGDINNADISLEEYIESNEYIKEEKIYFDNSKDFINSLHWSN